MKNPQDILTVTQYIELQKEVAAIVSNRSASKVILFGLVQSKSVRHNCFATEEFFTINQYFLLVVTRNEQRLRQIVQEIATTPYHKIRITTISCTFNRIETQLKKNDRFFNTVLKDGIALYNDNNKQETHIWEPDHLRILLSAERNYQNHWALALGFLAAAISAMEDDGGQPAIVVYFLQQATVQTCLTLIKICSGLKPPTRSLSKLLELCFCFEPYLSIHFKQNTNEEIRLFNVLLNAQTIDTGRTEFEATTADAELLKEQADEFMVMVEVCCGTRIKDLENQAMLSEGKSLPAN